MNPNGEIEILFLLNSWRDPRGKNIPKEEAARYRVPEYGPTLTYIHGTFKVSVGDEAIDNVYYAPIELKEDKTIVLGSTSSPPKTLILEEGVE